MAPKSCWYMLKKMYKVNVPVSITIDGENEEENLDSRVQATADNWMYTEVS